MEQKEIQNNMMNRILELSTLMHKSISGFPLCQDRCRLMEGHLYEVYNNI